MVGPCPQLSLFFRLAESPEEMEVSLLDGAECEEVAEAAVSRHPSASHPFSSWLSKPTAGYTQLITARRGGESQWLWHHVLTNSFSGC